MKNSCNVIFAKMPSKFSSHTQRDMKISAKVTKKIVVCFADFRRSRSELAHT